MVRVYREYRSNDEELRKRQFIDDKRHQTGTKLLVSVQSPECSDCLLSSNEH